MSFFFFGVFLFPGENAKNPHVFELENIGGFGWLCYQTKDWGKLDQIACAQHYSLDPACDRGLFYKRFLLLRTFCFFKNCQCPKPLAGQGWAKAACEGLPKTRNAHIWIGCVFRLALGWPHDLHLATISSQRLAIVQPRVWRTSFWGVGWK